MAIGGTFLNFDSLNPYKIWESLSLEVREALIKTGFRAGGNLVATEVVPRLFPKMMDLFCPGISRAKGFIYAGSTLFGFGANTFLRSIGEYVSAENNTSQSDFSLSLEGRGIQGEGEIPQQKKSYWDCVERAAAESFQTSLFTLTGMGSALGLKAFFGKNKNFAEKAVGLLGNKAPLIFQEVGMNLSTSLLQVGSQVLSGQPVTSSTLMNTGLMMLSGLGGTARESGLGNSFLSIAREAVHRVGETWVQSKIAGKEMNWAQAIGSLEGVTQRMMGGTLHLAGLSHRPHDIHPAMRFGENLGGDDLNHTVFTSMGATRLRQRWSDIPYENLSGSAWVEKIGEHLLKNGLTEKSKVRVGVDFMMKPEGIQPCFIHIPPKKTLATFHSQVTLEFEVKEREIVTAIAGINYGGKGDLPRLRSGLLGNRLLGKSTKENYPQIWYDCVEGRVDFLFHGQVVQGLGLGLSRKKANWVNQDCTTEQFKAYWADKSVHQLFENEPWVSNLKSGESVEMVLTGLATKETLRPQGCFVVGASSLVPQSPTIYKVKIKLTRTEKGYEIEGMEKDCSGNNASDVARMMGLNRSPIMPCADLFRLDKNEIPLDDWYEIIGNRGTGKERLNQLRKKLVGDERYKKGFVLRGYVEEGKVKNPLCQPLDLGSDTGKGITSIRFEFKGDGVVITGIDGLPRLLKHHHLVMGSHRIAPHLIPEAIDDAIMVEWRGVEALSSSGFTPLSQRELVALLHDDSLDWAWEKVRTQRQVPPFKAFLVIRDENSSCRIKIVRADVPPLKPDSWVIPATFGEKEVVIGEIPPLFSVAPHERIPMVIRVRPNAKSQLGLILKIPTMTGLAALCSSHGEDFITQWYKTTFGQHPKDGEVVSIYGYGHNYTNWRDGKIPGGSLILDRGLLGEDFPFYVPVFHVRLMNGEWTMPPGKSWKGAQVKRYVDLLIQHGCMKPNAANYGSVLEATSAKPSSQPSRPNSSSAKGPTLTRPQAILPERHTTWAQAFKGDRSLIDRMGALEARSSGLASPLARHLMHTDLNTAYGGRFGISSNLANRLEEKAEVYAYYDHLISESSGVDDDVFTRALNEATDRRNRGAQNTLLEMVQEYLEKLK